MNNAAALFFRGTKQIRTAVDGFADRYLTTRTWYHLFYGYKGRHFFAKSKHRSGKILNKSVFNSSLNLQVGMYHMSTSESLLPGGLVGRFLPVLWYYNHI